MSLQISPEAQRAINRLRRIDHAQPTLDRTAVENALRAHLAALGLPERPTVWVADAAAGYAHANTVWAAAWDPAMDAVWSAATAGRMQRRMARRVDCQDGHCVGHRKEQGAE